MTVRQRVLSKARSATANTLDIAMQCSSDAHSPCAAPQSTPRSLRSPSQGSAMHTEPHSAPLSSLSNDFRKCIKRNRLKFAMVAEIENRIQSRTAFSISDGRGALTLVLHATKTQQCVSASFSTQRNHDGAQQRRVPQRRVLGVLMNAQKMNDNQGARVCADKMHDRL